MKADELSDDLYVKTNELETNPDIICTTENDQQFEVVGVDTSVMPGALILKIEEVKP